MIQVLPTYEQIKTFRVLVVGDVMLDRYWFGEVARISPEVPAPVVQIKREENRLGGAVIVALNINPLVGNWRYSVWLVRMNRLGAFTSCWTNTPLNLS